MVNSKNIQKVLLCVFSLIVMGCGSNTHSQVNSILELKVTDSNIDTISVGICEFTLSISGTPREVKMEYPNPCSESSYEILLLYKDGKKITSNVGYSVGGVALKDIIEIKDGNVKLVKTEVLNAS